MHNWRVLKPGMLVTERGGGEGTYPGIVVCSWFLQSHHANTRLWQTWSEVVCVTLENSFLPLHFQVECLSCSTRSTCRSKITSASLCINNFITKNLDLMALCHWDSSLCAAREHRAGTHFLMWRLNVTLTSLESTTHCLSHSALFLLCVAVVWRTWYSLRL